MSPANGFPAPTMQSEFWFHKSLGNVSDVAELVLGFREPEPLHCFAIRLKIEL